MQSQGDIDPADVDGLDPDGPDRAAADGGEGNPENLLPDCPADTDDQEVLIDAVLAGDEDDPEPDADPA